MDEQSRTGMRRVSGIESKKVSVLAMFAHPLESGTYQQPNK